MLVDVRKIGIEEEMQLVDPSTGRPRPASHHAVEADRLGASDPADGAAAAGDAGVAHPGGALTQELFLHQLETSTEPCLTIDDLAAAIRAARRRAAAAAEEGGADMIAVPTPVLRGEVDVVTRTPRYERIVHDYGIIGREASVAGMHVHVDIGSDDEAVGVLDRIRPWLPVLLAVSSNSPYWLGVDSGYASWRAQVWGRWPSAGPAEPYGDAAGYRAATRAIMDTGAALDEGMLYLDARLAARLPTVEIRVADVCTEVEVVCLVAAMARALVEMAAREYAAGTPALRWRTDQLRAAHWKASRFGVGHDLVHPVDGRQVSAREAIEALLHHAQDALRDADDLERARDLVERLLARGSGAARQRAVVESGGSLRDVVADLAQRTRASWA